MISLIGRIRKKKKPRLTDTEKRFRWLPEGKEIWESKGGRGPRVKSTNFQF